MAAIGFGGGSSWVMAARRVDTMREEYFMVWFVAAYDTYYGLVMILM